MFSAKNIHSPNLFVVGAVKSGTSSLHAYLRQHPAIFMSPIKEPHFFSDDLRLENFSREYRDRVKLDVNEYLRNAILPSRHIAFIDELHQYSQLFREAGDASIIGESSPGYLYSNRAAERIFDFNPQAKILMVLRHPVERAYSHYLMDVRDFENSDVGFVAAFERDVAAVKKGWGNSHLYLELGLYSDQVQRYLDRFPEEQLKICLYDDLQHDPAGFMGEIFQFLGVDGTARDVIELSTHEHVASLPKFTMLNRLLFTSDLAKKLSNVLPHKFRRYLKKSMLSQKSIPQLKQAEFDHVIDYFRDDIQKLSVLLHRDLRQWSHMSK